jgi:cytoskeleton protein RodZ
MGELNVGSPYTVPPTAKDPLLTTGRPQSLKVSVGRSVVPPLGDGSRTVSKVSLKADALLGRAAQPPSPVASASVRSNP